MTHAPVSALRTNRGFILVAVLWLLTALATLASIYSAYSVNTAVASHAADDRLQADASIRAAIEMTAFRELAFADVERPSQGRFTLRVGRTDVDVGFVSEAARVDLNAAPADLLAGVFVSAGADASRSAEFAERVVGWRTVIRPNTVSREAEHYERILMPYPPRQAPFDSAEELRLVAELPPDVVERMLPLVTVFSGHAEIDVLTADSAVLSALPGMTPGVLDALLKVRAKAPDNRLPLLSMLGPARNRAASEGPRTIRERIDVRFDNGRRVSAEVVIRLKDGEKDPYDLLFWSDDLDGPPKVALGAGR
jgi:general secretion pathway protein K